MDYWSSRTDSGAKITEVNYFRIVHISRYVVSITVIFEKNTHHCLPPLSHVISLR